MKISYLSTENWKTGYYLVVADAFKSWNDARSNCEAMGIQLGETPLI